MPMLFASPLPPSFPPNNPLPRIQPLRIPPPPLNLNLNLTFNDLPLPASSSTLPHPHNQAPWPGATALQQTCRELQNLIANSSNRIRQPPPITSAATTTTRPVALQSPIKFRTLQGSRGGRAGGGGVQKPSKRRERGTAQLLRVAARNSNHEGKEGEEREGRGEVDYEGIRDMFCTPVRSTAVVCDGVVVHPAGSGAAATTEWRRLMHEGKGDAAVAGEGGLGLGKGDEARVGMLLRRMRLGCSRVGKARGRCVGG